MLAQHLYTIMMFQRLAIANGHGWNRFLHTVDQVLPRRGDTLPLPFEEGAGYGDEAANQGGLNARTSSAASAPPMAVPLGSPVHAVSEAPVELAGWRIYQGGWLRGDRLRPARQHGDRQ